MLRDRFPEITGPLYFPYVYRLYSDQSAFGFHVDYSLDSRQQYKKFYTDIKSEDNKYLLPVKIAALMAIQEEKFVCGEISEIRNNANSHNDASLQNSTDKSTYKSIDQWIDKLPSIGYPPFNLNNCSKK